MSKATNTPDGFDLYCGDMLSVIPNLGRTVDLVFCSPPYEAARSYGIGFNLRGDEFVKWCADRFEACLSVCNGLVAWVIEGQTRQYRWSATPALLMAELHRRGVHLRKPPVYKRVGIPGSGGPDWLRNDYEFIICGTKGGKLPWSENTAMGHKPKWAPGGEMSHRLSDGTKRNQWGASSKSTGGERGVDGVLRQAAPRPSHVFSSKREGRLTRIEKLALGAKSHTKRDAAPGDAPMREQAYLPPAIANPGNIISCVVGGNQMGSKLSHENEAPFPESLAEFFVRSFCPPGGVVLDPFSGSGTTLAAARKHGRLGIGIDIRDSQIDLTRRRLEEVGARLLPVTATGRAMNWMSS